MDNAVSVLVTGAAGRVGQAACETLLARGHRVRAFDIRKSPGADDARVGVIRSVPDDFRAFQAGRREFCCLPTRTVYWHLVDCREAAS